MRVRPDPGRLLYVARAIRDFADGFVAILLPVYLFKLGFSPVHIGLLATVALLGSALQTLGVGFAGARISPRNLAILAAMLMAATGAALSLANSYPVLLVVAFFGTINPTAGNVSVFVPLEHAMLAGLVSDGERTRSFARYALAGALAAAVGALAASSPDLLARIGLSAIHTLKLMFLLYGGLGLAAGYAYGSTKVGPQPNPGEPKSALGPSRGIVLKLAALFSLDAFAGGFAVQSLLSVWLLQTFGLSLWVAGLFFFWSGVASAFSFPVSVWLSKRIGLVNTMVYTHIPSSIFLILAAVAPDWRLALSLLLARAALSQMDVPTRSSYVMAVVTPPERAAAASFTSVPRSLASSLSPALAGALLALPFGGWPLIICGVLKIIYDLALLWTFRNVRPPEEV